METQLCLGFWSDGPDCSRFIFFCNGSPVCPSVVYRSCLKTRRYGPVFPTFTERNGPAFHFFNSCLCKKNRTCAIKNCHSQQTQVSSKQAQALKPRNYGLYICWLCPAGSGQTVDDVTRFSKKHPACTDADEKNFMEIFSKRYSIFLTDLKG